MENDGENNVGIGRRMRTRRRRSISKKEEQIRRNSEPVYESHVNSGLWIEFQYHYALVLVKTLSQYHYAKNSLEPRLTIAKRLVGVEMVVGTTSKDKSKPQRIAAEVAIYPNDRICTPCL